MDDFKGVFTLVIIVVVIASRVLGPMLERRRKAQQERQSRPSRAEPEPETQADEPMLPYENLVEEVFGPHIQRRREAHARRAEERAEKAQTTVRRAVPPLPPRPAAPARPAVGATSDATKAAAPSTAQAAPLRPRHPALSLEERLFSNRRLSGAAKLVVAAEILQPPRFLRRRLRGQ